MSDLRTQQYAKYGLPLPEQMFGLSGPDAPSEKDYIKAPIDGPVKPVNLLDSYNPVRRDQGATNRCTSFSNAGVMEWYFHKLMGDGQMFSANDQYWFIRPDPKIDSGGGLREAAMTMVKHGGCNIGYWPDRADFRRRPAGLEEQTEHRRFHIPVVERVVELEILRQTLSIERLPVKIGRRMFRNATDYACATGYYPKHDPNDVPTGLHDEWIAGWDYFDGERQYLFVGSWGPQVGHRRYRGCFWVPEHYFTLGLVVDQWGIGKEAA